MVEELTRNTDERAPKSKMMILKKVIEELRGELCVYKTAVTNGVMSGTPSTPIEVPKPKEFKGTRNAQDVENYILELEEYFQAANITEDTKKVKIASIYLTDFARMWWRRRCTDEKHGGTKVETWEEFQEELKAHFYPVYAEEEAQSKLRQLKHTGNIRDYVREFTELHLQIPDMTEKQALFTFRDGLKPWAKAELQRRGVTELSKALAAAESLTEFQKSESPKPKSSGNNRQPIARSSKFTKPWENRGPGELLESIKEGLSQDPTAKSLVDYVKEGKSRQFWIEGDLLYKQGHRLYIPQFNNLRKKLMTECHDSKWVGHPGIHRTLALITDQYYWPHMDRDVETYVKTCLICQQDKVETKKPMGLLQPLPIPERPWESISLDFIIGLPNTDNCFSIMVVVDRFSKYATFIPASKVCHAEEAARLFLKHVVKYWGIPKTIISDRDTRFTGSWELDEDLWQFKDKIAEFHQQQATRTSLNSVGENVTSDQPTTESYTPKEAQTSTHHVAHDPRAQVSTKQVAKEVKTQQNYATTSPIRPRVKIMEEMSSIDPHTWKEIKDNPYLSKLSL
ncbi:hypothetical protein GQ457_02G038830 [Hibiscus cannabinus]